MQISDSFFDVCSQFFATGISLPVFLCALLYLYRKWNREKRDFLVVLCITGICLVFNEGVYQAANFVGESMTYYRFLWICPLALIVVWCIIDLIMLTKKTMQILLVATLIVGLLLFSQRTYTTWFLKAENVYQLDNNVIQIADTIMELTGGEPASLLDNGNVTDTIRQYNANIQYPIGSMYFLYNPLYGINTNYLGRYIQDYLVGTHPRYLALQKDVVETYRVFESAGVEYVAETDTYYIYMVSYEDIDADQEMIYQYGDTSRCMPNLEYIPIKNARNEQKFFYVSTLNEEKGNEEHRAMIDSMNESEMDYVIINNPNIAEDMLKELEIPYYCNNKEIQVIETEDYNLCLIDNSREVTGVAINSLLELYREEKEIILILSEELQEDKENNLFRAIVSEESKVCEILTVREEYQKSFIDGRILQYATPKANGTILNIVRIVGTERV